MKKYNMLIVTLLVLATIHYREIVKSDWLYLALAGLGILLLCGVVWLILRVRTAVRNIGVYPSPDTKMQKYDDFFAGIWFVCLVILMLLLFIPLLLKDRIELWLDKKRRAASLWQPPVYDADFLAGCGIAADSPEAETALTIRRKLAGEISAWSDRPAMQPEDIVPDMLCRELLRDCNWPSLCKDGWDSFGFEVVRQITMKNPLPPEALEIIIQPEKKSRATVSQLIRNYLDVIAAHSSEVKS